jgi:hypothetical protein
LNIKLKDKKKVAVNGVLAQTSGGARNKFNNKRGREFILFLIPSFTIVSFAIM